MVSNEQIDLIPKIAPPNTTGVPRIVIPAGIGDAYWVMIKMEAFCRRKGITEKPNIILLVNNASWDVSRIRSISFLKMIPFVTIGDPQWVAEDWIIPRPQYLQDLYDESRVRYGRTVFPGFMGYEYFISYNGWINTGHWLEEDDLECNWYLPLIVSEEQERFKNECIQKYGKYVAFYFSNFTEEMIMKFSIEKIIESIKHFINRSGLTPVFIGADWDLGWSYLLRIMKEVPGSVNIVGKTTLDQAFGVIRGAELVSGYHCGLTNMAIVFKKKTTLIWVRESFPPATSLAVAPPETRNTTYRPLFAAELTIDKYVESMKELYEQK